MPTSSPTLSTDTLNSLRIVADLNPGSTLCVFFPLAECLDDAIPWSRSNGLIKACPEWQDFARYLHGVSSDSKTDDRLTEIAENASYGGCGGIILTFRKSTLDAIDAEGDLAAALRRDYANGNQHPRWLRNKHDQSPRLWIAVLDFLNGSGATHEIDCNWADFKVPNPTATPVLVNNMLDSIFWFAELGKVDAPDTLPGLNVRS